MKFLHLFRKHWVQGVLVCFILFAAFVSLLPIGIKWFVEDWYKTQGVESVKIEDVDFNLFTGVLGVESIEVISNSEVVFSIDSAEVNVSWLELFSKHIHIQSINFRKLLINVEQITGKPLMLAGIPLGAANTMEEPESDDKPGEKSDWGFGITDTHIENLVLKYNSEKIKTDFVLHNADLKNALTWMPDNTAVLELTGEINNSPLLLSAELKPFSDSPELKARIKVDGFAVSSVGELAKPGISKLSGKLFVDSSLVLKVIAQESFDLSAKGQYRLQDGEIELTEQVIEAEDLVIAGSLNVSQSLGASTEENPVIIFSGNAETKTVSVVDKKRNIKLAEATSLTLNKIDIKKLDSIFVDKISASNLVLIDEVPVGEKQDKAAQTKTALVTIKAIDAGFLQLENLGNLMLEKVSIVEAVTRLDRDKHGKIPLLEKLSAGTEEASISKPEKAVVDAKVAETSDAQPFQFKIGSISVTEESRLLFRDASVIPKFESSVLIKNLQIQNVESGNEERETDISLMAEPGKYSKFEAKGKVKLFSMNRDFSLTANISKYELPHLSSYTSQSLGYDLLSGQGNVKLVANRVKDKIDGKVDLVFHNLTVKETNPEHMKELNEKLSIPLSSALSLLRDKDDDIKLSIPVTGKLLDPNVGVGDVINTALGKALKASTVSYLKYMFQPYGTLISIVQLAGSVAGSVKLDPVSFAEGEAGLDEKSEEYLQKINELLKSREGIRLKLCGASTEKDRVVLLEKADKSKQPKITNDDLFELAKKRAESVKDYLVTRFKVDPGRLFVCHPEIKKEEDASPQVELLI